ncbi:hypothetical protein D9M69_580250 [compost metagenome]
MGQAGLQAVARCGCLEVLHGLLGAGVETAHVLVQANRDGALVLVEELLELRFEDGARQVVLRLDVRLVAQLEHRQGVDVVGEAALGAGERQALVVLARYLAGGAPLALGPVAHDLHAGLAADDQARGAVPVAARGVGVDVATQLLQGGEDFDHPVAGEGGLVLFDEGFVIALRP